MDAVADTAAPARGLARLWGWIRRTILGSGVVAQRQVTRDDSRVEKETEAGEDDAPVEPRGAVFRGVAARRTTPSVFAPIRQGLAEVPPLPHVVRELMRELSDPMSNARSVARIAASDPALAASLIRTVNSAALGVRRKVTSVAEAVSYLGYSLVRSLVVRMRLQQVMPARAGQAAYDAEDLWVHSLAVAYAAEALADRCPGVDKAFVCTLGLLHDIGKLAINSYFPASAAQVRTPSPDHPSESFLDRERRILGADHAEIGAMLATHWKLPADLVEAIRWHHSPQDAPATLGEGVKTATILVHVANQLAKYCYVYSEDMEIDIVGDELLKEAGLPGPLTRLLNQRVRNSISRAIFFADDSSTQSLGAIRRFVRLGTWSPDAPMPPRDGRSAEMRIGWAEEGWERRFFGEPADIDCSPSAAFALSRSLASAGNCARLTSRCNAGGIDRLLTAALAHQERLGLDERMTVAARFVLRRLLPNLSEIAAAEVVEVLQTVREGMLITAVRSPGLSFVQRLGFGVEGHAGRAWLQGELANVLNLRWFNRVLTSRDGEVIVFVNRAA
ncbi:MAG: metal dependent phosphohydrolase [Phycisphaerales bacterium]|nr:metal dependent phosphohydrolase [Phycisphaerales bacterium]